MKTALIILCGALLGGAIISTMLFYLKLNTVAEIQKERVVYNNYVGDMVEEILMILQNETQTCVTR
jgi:hypothetical protein